jgi:hypothetical protein
LPCNGTGSGASPNVITPLSKRLTWRFFPLMTPPKLRPTHTPSRRSSGFTSARAAGSRLLEERDRNAAGEARVVFNEPALLVRRRVAQPQLDPQKWQEIQRLMEERGQVQRGIPRVKDPARYPLACRLVDLTGGCGSILYARTNQGRPVYTCARYMRSSGSECHSNQVDAEAMLRFVLKTLRQLVDRHGNREKLRQKLLVRARQAVQQPAEDPRAKELAGLRARHADVLGQMETIEYRMARERDDGLYAALTRQYAAARAELETAKREVQRLEAEQTSARSQAPEEQAESALALLDDVARVTGGPPAPSRRSAPSERLPYCWTPRMIGLRHSSPTVLWFHLPLTRCFTP